jgi:hypothetical protein
VCPGVCWASYRSVQPRERGPARLLAFSFQGFALKKRKILREKEREEKRGLCCFIYFGKPPRAKVKKGKHPCAAAAVVVVIGCILSLLVFFSSRAKTTLK